MLASTAQQRVMAPARMACELPQQARLVRASTRRAARSVRVRAEEEGGSAASSSGAETTAVEQQQLTRTIKRPLGLVLAESEAKDSVFVESIVPGGNAENFGDIQVGDVLSEVSATVLKAGKEGQFEREGYGQRPYDNWETTMFDCKGQDFSTVMSAIDSNNPRWGINTVTLVLKRKL